MLLVTHVQIAQPAPQTSSQKSGSSSEPSDEVLDDPTNIALSQRPHAHLPAQPQTGNHGDPMLQAAAANDVQQETAEAEEALPTRQMSKPGQWMTKQGTVCYLAIVLKHSLS